MLFIKSRIIMILLLFYLTSPFLTDDFVNLSVYVARYRYFPMSTDVTILSRPEERLTKVVPHAECSGSPIPMVSAVSSDNTLCIAATPRDDAPCQVLYIYEHLNIYRYCILYVFSPVNTCSFMKLQTNVE